MEIPPEFVQKLNASPQLAQALYAHPIAFFGATVKFPKQADIVREWLKRQPRITVVTGWKRTGKTNVCSFLGCCWLEGKINPQWPGAVAMGITQPYEWKSTKSGGKRRMLIGGSSMAHIQSVLLAQYMDLLPPGHIKKWYGKQDKEIIMNGGRTSAVVRSYDQDLMAWKSDAYDMIHLDEEPPMEILRECIERIKTTDGKIIISVALDDADVSYLPDAIQNPEKYFGTKDIMHVQLGVEDVPDDIYPPLAKREIFRIYDGTPLRDAVRKGAWPRMSGKWWPEFDIATHVIKSIPLEKMKFWNKARAMDAGTAAACGNIWVAMHPSGEFAVAYREYYKAGTRIDQRCEEVIALSGNSRQRDGNTFYEIQKQEKFDISLLDYHEFKVDATTGAGLEQHYINAGLNVQPSTTLQQEGRREVVRRWLQVDPKRRHFITKKPGAPKLYIFDTCPNLIWEAGKKVVRRENNERAGTSEKKIENRDDHLMDCLEYLCAEMDLWTKDSLAGQEEDQDED